ncbi:MAG: LysR family transcriptional regulator [Reyranella sp.]|uniref:LysR substrate-binding domain-containing protein n=1 Tax=Reyranella sp. TaxID=1929291 RepID=UPI0012065A63|nr:LysR substrate-binding domain-containing protein [Reyranella sp.]TAJ97385.1 MAG: LysR family transcriptional regulator [Reyranella sp.]TBR30892.1 MAG: LysR family transcriptional regulator [Reyranella sp.]
MKFSLEEIEVFLTVVDTGSLTAAALRLGQPVSTTSRLLRRLEKSLRTTLLRRTTRRLDLTDEGCGFLEDARAILASVQAAEERLVQRHGQPSGPLRIDASTPVMLHVLAPLMDGYRRRYPLVELELSNNEGYVDLLERRIDLAIRIGPLKDSTLHSRLLGHCRIRLLASPAYIKRHGLPDSADELLAPGSGHMLLGFSQPDSLNVWPLRHGSDKALHIRPDIAASSGEVLHQLALNGQGIVCLSDFMTDGDRARGALVEVLADQNPGTTQAMHAVYYKNSAVSLRVSSFVDHLVEASRTWRWVDKPSRRQRD